MRHSLLYLGVLAALALLSTWFLSTVESTLREGPAQYNNTPSLLMDNFLAVRMNEQGVREYAVASPHLVQLGDQQGTRIDSPHIDVFQDGQIRDWSIRAESGWVSPDNELIRLQESVSIVRPAESGKQPMVITTRNVLVRPGDDTVETDEPVRMETPGGWMEAIGLRANLRTKQMHLLSHVRSIYETPRL